MSSSSTSASTYWVIAVPSKSVDHGNAERERVNRATQARKLSNNFPFQVPHELRVGTLDSLMSLSDALGKMDQAVEQNLKRMQRTYLDLSGIKIAGVEKFPSELHVDAKIPDKYVQEFRWNKAKYPLNTSLKDLANSIAQTSETVNKALSGRLGKLNEARGILQGIDRRETGSLLTRPLTGLINEEDLPQREYITTVLAVIQKNRMKEWENTYETLEEEHAKRKAQEKEESKEVDEEKEVPSLSAEEIRIKQDIAKLEEAAMEVEADVPGLDDYRDILRKKKEREDMTNHVVPRSAKILYDKDDEYVIYRVIVFRNGLEHFKAVCRENLYFIREYKFDDTQKHQDEQKKEQVQLDVKNFHLALLRWCQPQYSDLFSAWIHLKAIRTFVESVLRFGLPVNFTSLFIKPMKGRDKNVRKVLEDLYAHLGSVGPKTGAAEVDFTGLAGDFYPYVYIPIKFGESEEER